MTSNFLAQLTGGDRRSIGNADLAVRQVLDDPALFAEIIGGLSHEDPLIRMRCADVAEKVSLVHPGWLTPHKPALVHLAATSTEQELRWHLAQMLPRLDLDGRERRVCAALMQSYLNDKSRIVQTFAMQALFDLSANDAGQRRKLLPLFEGLARDGSPAVRARARKLIAASKDARTKPR
jgi:HEAT repeat protein